MMVRLTLLLSVCLLQCLFFIYSTNAGECCVHNRPTYLTTIEEDDEGAQEQGATVSDFSNNLATLLGLTPDMSDRPVTILRSNRPLEMPQSTWLFHVKGVDKLYGHGMPLEDNRDFDIEQMHEKLSLIGSSNELTRNSISIDTEESAKSFPQELNRKVGRMDEQAALKYIVIDCAYCSTDESTKNEFVKQLQTEVNRTVRAIVDKNPQALALTLSTLNGGLRRQKRQTTFKEVRNITIAPMYSDLYPTMFNLFFWTSLTLVLALIAIVYVFLTIDPGTDTIIYRLTAPRPKLD